MADEQPPATTVVHAIRPGVLAERSDQQAKVIEDIELLLERVRSGVYRPMFGVFAFKNQTGAVFTHTLGEMSNIELIGVMHCAVFLHTRDGCG